MILLVLAAAPSPSRAEDADALIKKGVELRRAGRDREALAEFQRALEIQNRPRTVAQIALAEQALGLFLQAEQHMTEALAQQKDPWIRKNQSTLEGALRSVQTHLASVEVWGSPEGAEILLDGKVVATLPMARPARVTESQVTLQVRAKGHVEISRVLQISLGDLVREHVELRPSVALAAPPSAPAPARPPPAAMVAVSAPGTGDGEPAPSHSITRTWWFWTGLGVIVAAGAVTAVALANSRAGVIPPCADAECPRQ